MGFQISDDIAIKVLIEESLGLAPSAETADVSLEFREKVRREVGAIKDAGGLIEVPAAFPDPDEPIID